MRTVLHRWLIPNQALLLNAGSLVAATAVTAILGFFYWWFAARMFQPEALGFASAAISAMLLLGLIGVMGFGTLLIGELPRNQVKAGSLITTSLLIVSVTGGILGVLFVVIAPWISSDLRALGKNIETITLFSLGVSLTSVTLVLDEALVGLLRGEFQLGRNLIFAVVKLIAILVVGIWLVEKSGMMIYATWVIGILASLIILVMIFIVNNYKIVYRPTWDFLRNFGRLALGHHMLNLALQAPGFILPIMVTALLSARINAYFYMAWMVVSLIYVGPVALSTVLYAVSSENPTVLVPKIRLTLKLSFGVGLAANVVLLVIGGHILYLFGAEYTEYAGLTLRILGLGVFPLIVRVHYVAICRVYGQLAKATKLVIFTGLIALTFAAFGARIGGLYGLSLGWVAGMCLEAIIMTPLLVSVAVFKKTLAVRGEDYEDRPSPEIDHPSTDSSGMDR